MTTTHVVFLSLMFSSPLRIIFLPLSFYFLLWCKRCHLLSGNKRKKNDKNSGAIVNDESTIVDNEADGATILRRKSDLPDEACHVRRMCYMIVTSRTLLWTLLTMATTLAMVAAVITPTWLIGPSRRLRGRSKASAEDEIFTPSLVVSDVTFVYPSLTIDADHKIVILKFLCDGFFPCDHTSGRKPSGFNDNR
ncbi:unnamed protein product [Larinioides sclopetarius]|uniref:Uncharacterized protein n=1 Tax=Larinioides sclopetarius TaxID=280406 RepID=A0AAV1ZKJ0_9ARAC